MAEGHENVRIIGDPKPDHAEPSISSMHSSSAFSYGPGTTKGNSVDGRHTIIPSARGISYSNNSSMAATSTLTDTARAIVARWEELQNGRSPAPFEMTVTGQMFRGFSDLATYLGLEPIKVRQKRATADDLLLYGEGNQQVTVKRFAPLEFVEIMRDRLKRQGLGYVPVIAILGWLSYKDKDAVDQAPQYTLWPIGQENQEDVMREAKNLYDLAKIIDVTVKEALDLNF